MATQEIEQNQSTSQKSNDHELIRALLVMASSAKEHERTMWISVSKRECAS